MTVRHYYTDAYTTEFDARVVGIDEEARRFAIQLDSTYFYPTSGGQPHDTGTLAGASLSNAVDVVDVIVGEDGSIDHILAPDSPRPALHSTIQGQIDWPRRFDHMQQHSGQHLLSQAFFRLCELETVSVHFGAQESTIDLAGALSSTQLNEVETSANQVVAAAHPIKAYFVDEADLAQIPLRRPPQVSGQIRIVEIEGYDYSACGGTHVRTTAEIGPIKLLRSEHRRDQTRVTFLCGGRTWADYQQKHTLLAETAALYSTEIGQVPGLVAKAQEQIKQLQQQVDTLTTQLLAHEVAALRTDARVVNGHQVICHLWDEQASATYTIDALKQAAHLLVERPETIALLGMISGGKTTVVFARAQDVNLHIGNLLRTSLQEFGGGGGGRPDFAQGGGVAAKEGPDLLEFACNQLQRQI